MNPATRSVVLALDPAANSLGKTTNNASELFVGGNRSAGSESVKRDESCGDSAEVAVRWRGAVEPKFVQRLDRFPASLRRCQHGQNEQRDS